MYIRLTVDTHPGNIKIMENLGKLKTVLIFFKNFREVLRFIKKTQGNIFLDLEKKLVNPVSIFG